MINELYDDNDAYVSCFCCFVVPWTYKRCF